MQNTEWISLLRLIPPDQAENLMITVGNDMGIIIQKVIRAEPDYLVIRGRLAGTTDEGGNFFFVPYDQINFMGLQRPVKETAILAMFEGQPTSPNLGERPAGVPLEKKTPQESAPTPPPEPARPPEPLGGVGQTVGPGKAALLERLRARRSSSDSGPKPAGS